MKKATQVSRMVKVRLKESALKGPFDGLLREHSRKRHINRT
jgi:hypothetical protein